MSIFLKEFRKGAREAWHLYFLPLRAIVEAIRAELAKDGAAPAHTRR